MLTIQLSREYWLKQFKIRPEKQGIQFALHSIGQLGHTH